LPDTDDRRTRGPFEDEAVFAPARLAAGRRTWLPIAAFVLVVAGLIGAGTVLDRLDPTDRSVAPVAQQPGPSAGVALATATPPRTTGPQVARIRPTLLAIDARPFGSHVFVNGDVFSLDAFLVVVSLEAHDTVTATHKVRMPGGSTAFLTEANPRFLVLFDVPDAPGQLWIRANAYDAHGDIVASLREPVLARNADQPSSAAR
jgi:hypothetical protein